MLNSRVEDINFYSKRTIRLGEKLLDLSFPKVMGIINCTPDSFYEESRFNSLTTILKEVEKQISEGVDLIDIGGYSSKPGAEKVNLEEELKRVIPAIQTIKKEFPELIVSIDTFKAKVADEAIQVGANIINDISAYNLDKEMFSVLEKHKCPYILMHMKGSPETMQQHTHYDSLFKEMVYFFSEKIASLKKIGVHDIILDPGFGFAKTLEQNYEILNKTKELCFLNQPILIGLSRKSMIYKKLKTNPQEALNGTSILNTKAILNGASILRVHDVKEAKEILNLLY